MGGHKSDYGIGDTKVLVQDAGQRRAMVRALTVTTGFEWQVRWTRCLPECENIGARPFVKKLDLECAGFHVR